MKTTTDLFWQMILQEECAVVVMLCDCVELREVVSVCMFVRLFTFCCRIPVFHIGLHHSTVNVILVNIV